MWKLGNFGNQKKSQFWSLKIYSGSTKYIELCEYKASRLSLAFGYFIQAISLSFFNYLILYFSHSLLLSFTLPSSGSR